MKKRRGKRRRRQRRIRVCIRILGLGIFLGAGIYGIQNVSDGASKEDIPQEQEVEEGEALSVEVEAKEAFVVCQEDGSVLFEKDSQSKIAPASTTKLLTAYTALQCCKQSESITVGEELDFVAWDASRAWLCEGDELTVEDMLSAMLLPSGNDAAYALAAFCGRKLARGQVSTEEAVERFVEEMNENAKSLGATHSHFVTPDGYDAQGQYTTAYDLWRIAAACEENEVISEITSCYKDVQKWESGQEVTYYNTNELLDPQGCYYEPEVTGMKTGSSSKAGGCVISSAEISGKEYILVVMGSTQEGRFRDTCKLLDAIEIIE